MYSYRDEDTLLELVQSLIRSELNVTIINIEIEEPEEDLNYHIKHEKSYYYKLNIYFKYNDSHQLESAVLFLPKLENNLYYYNFNNIPKLKVMVNTFLLDSPFIFEKKRKEHLFKIPKLFNINNEKNTIYYNKQSYNLTSLDSLNIKLPERCWKKLNYFNKNITSNLLTYDIYINDIYPTLMKYKDNFNEIMYYDLNIMSLKEKFLLSLYDNNYIKHKLNLHYKKLNKLYLTPLQSAINDFFSMVDNTDIQTIITTNPMSLESQLNKVYIEKNKHKYKINYNKSFINFLCPVHTHEGQLNNIRNELANLVDKETFKLKLLDKNNQEVLVNHYDYYNSYLYINDTIKLYRGEYIESNNWDYKKRNVDNVLSISSSCIPMINSTDSVRGILGTTMMTQAIPVIGSTPNIIYTDAEKEIFDRCNLNIYSSYQGTITKITTYNIVIDNVHIIKRPDSIKSNNNTYNNYYLNPELSIGMTVNNDTIIYILDSFKNNQLCLSVQSRIAYMNYYGYTFEDGIVISKSMSKKLGHIHRERLEYKLNNIEDVKYISNIDDIKSNKSVILSYNANTNNDKLKNIKELLDIPQLELINIKLPNHISQGKIINTEIMYKDNLDNSIRLKFNESKKDPTIEYKYCIYITVEYINYAKLGDKLTNRYGSKGVITNIVDDDLMPRDDQDNPIELIMSPDSIISRKNVSQIPEVELGNILTKIYQMNLPANHEVFNILYENKNHNYYHKFARKYGYYCLKLNALNNINYHELINKLNNILNIKSYIKLYDPKLKRWIKNEILVGYTALLRLHFIVEHKSKSSNDYVAKHNDISYETDTLINGGGYNKIDGQKIGEMELWTFLTYNNLSIIKYLQGPKIRQHKVDSLKLSMLQSGIKPIIEENR